MSGAPDFAFLTNYGKTLLVIATDPRVRTRDIAALLQITERAAQRIVAELAKPATSTVSETGDATATPSGTTCLSGCPPSATSTSDPCSPSLRGTSTLEEGRARENTT